MNFLGRIIDFIAPRTCALCGCRLTTDEQVMCSVCNAFLPRTHYHNDAENNEMCRLFFGKLRIQRANALFFYQPNTPESMMTYQLKYDDRPEIGYQLGRITAAECLASGFFDSIDAIIPVPLNKRRQQQRGYNQSLEIARGVADIARVPIYNNVVKRIRATESQTTVNPQQRVDNVENAFSLRKPNLVMGKHLLLIDDIVTTGATISACGRELMKAGRVTISVLSLGFTKG